jgi:hypothetical protein
VWMRSGTAPMSASRKAAAACISAFSTSSTKPNFEVRPFSPRPDRYGRSRSNSCRTSSSRACLPRPPAAGWCHAVPGNGAARSESTEESWLARRTNSHRAAAECACETQRRRPPAR